MTSFTPRSSSRPSRKGSPIPELPEVETVRTQLSKLLPFVVRRVWLSGVVSSILKEKEFNLEGRTLRTIARKGKLLQFKTDQGHSVLSHLGMTGSWRVSSRRPVDKHRHIELRGRDRFLTYVDPRRFGKQYWVCAPRARELLSRIGVDISSSEFTADYLWQTLKRYPNRQLKPFLLDQKYFGGSGNYIANEICARAGIRPTRRAGRVRKDEIPRLLSAVTAVLDHSLRGSGVTFRGGYQDTDGKKGQGLQHLVVFYQSVCQICRTTPVKKITLAQRGTYYCPRCQK